MTARLTEFQVHGLFGLYDHVIPLQNEERITIIIGPNGRGKTVCLKLIEALFLQKFDYFLEIPFDWVQYTFDTGEIITIRRDGFRDPQNSADVAVKVFLSTLDSPVEKQIELSIFDSRTKTELRRHIPSSWEMVSHNLWIDQVDGEELTAEELMARYNVPKKVMEAFRRRLPDDILQLIDPIDCHLIETQRLLVLPTVNDHNDFEFAPHTRRHRRRTALAIQQKAEKLKIILKDKLSVYANTSQSLDRSFPLRVFEAQGSATLSQDQLREALRGLDDRRAALMKAGILDSDIHPVMLRQGNIDSGVAMALEIYVKDASEKLDLFNDLRARLDLFKELIESRFTDKFLQIDRSSGFKIISRTDREVALDRLSSGEQHQLILLFDLLFEVSPNSLILIDEPELSLHVAWQKSFIDSLRSIIALNSFDVVLATHSPAVLAGHLSLRVELGPVE